MNNQYGIKLTFVNGETYNIWYHTALQRDTSWNNIHNGISTKSTVLTVDNTRSIMLNNVIMMEKVVKEIY